MVYGAERMSPIIRNYKLFMSKFVANQIYLIMKSYIITLILLICFSQNLFSEDNGTRKKAEATNIALRYVPKLNRPRKPANIWICCVVQNGILTFNPSDIYSSLFVTVTDEATGEVWTSIIDEDLMSMEFTDRPGHYEIECENEQGGCFVGAIDQ